VKQVLTQNPGRIRPSMRRVAFHEGSEQVVQLLKASRNQDEHWQILETLLAMQTRRDRADAMTLIGAELHKAD
jgi:Trp operon repressor